MVPPVEQEPLALPNHLCLPQVFSGIHVAQSLVFCEVFCRPFFGGPFFLAIVLLVLRIIDIDGPFSYLFISVYPQCTMKAVTYLYKLWHFAI